MEKGFMKFWRKHVAISGGFDPITVGHVRYIEAAAAMGRKLTVIVNRDDFLMRKKGYVFMPFKERAKILLTMRGVSNVVICIDNDNSVCRTLRVVRPDIFAKGGDRTKDNIPEVDVCKELDIKIVDGVGGYDKPQSSSWLVDRLIKQIKKDPNLRRKYDIS
jgi:D-beta-D-heptose 7-phosphate kinase/D-beta-D-heptose 1-phosphate adenosyltransferase